MVLRRIKQAAMRNVWGRSVSEEIELDAVKSLPRLFFDQVARFEGKPFLSAKQDGQWRGQSWSKVAEQVFAFAKTHRVSHSRSHAYTNSQRGE